MDKGLNPKYQEILDLIISKGFYDAEPFEKTRELSRTERDEFYEICVALGYNNFGRLFNRGAEQRREMKEFEMEQKRKRDEKLGCERIND